VPGGPISPRRRRNLRYANGWVKRDRPCGSLIVVSVPREKVIKICEDILAPLIRADGGELFIVAIEPESIALHLAGKCSGCPGATMTSTAIIEPAIRAAAPGMRVVITSGFQIPAGASPVTGPAPSPATETSPP
jgi:Fe-S cluster biogenesis protein NfuA